MHVNIRSANRIGGLLSGPIVLVIGLGILFLGWQWRTFTQNQIATMLLAEGKVVEVVSRTKTSSGERKTYFYPVVEFRTADGESVRFESSTGSNPSAYRVGDAVKVRYDLQTPQSAVIDSWELWLPSSIVIGVGGFFCADRHPRHSQRAGGSAEMGGIAWITRHYSAAAETWVVYTGLDRECISRLRRRRTGHVGL